MQSSPHLQPLRDLLLACVLAAPAALVLAGPLADPTRPPSWSAPAASAATARTAVARAAAAEPRTPPRLQSVQLPDGGAASAVVDGRVVQAGDRIGTSVVMAIDAQGLVLRNGAASERLWLLAAEGKRPAGSVAENRSASFTPAPGTDVGPSTAAAAPSPPAAPAGATVSLAGKATP